MNITSAEGFEAMSKLKGMLRKSFASWSLSPQFKSLPYMTMTRSKILFLGIWRVDVDTPMDDGWIYYFSFFIEEHIT